ncbi:putative replication endonuclease from prophage-like region 1 [Bienertia sinuspersici]
MNALYLHPSDGQSSIVVEKLTGSVGSCNNVMISCIFANVIENIKKSIIFTSSAQEVWKSLEIWFSQLSGLRKFKLCREVYDLKQRGRSVIDYYTSVYALWEKIEELNVCPPLTKVNTEMRAYLNALK